ncbi:MAG: adenine-specific methyltransferase EcoRI family protein [Planctomycetota bacterium]
MAKKAPLKAKRMSKNRSLSAAKTAKQDEFYTQYADIQKEVEAYVEFDSDTFRGKIVYCNCDDPFESNFFKYFAANFNKLGLKKLIATSYDGSPIAGQRTMFPEYHAGNGKRKKPKALAVIIDHVKDEDGDGAVNVIDVELFLKRNKAARIALKGNDQYPGGDFRSPECITFLKEADIVVTNPPFSLFREYVSQLVEHGKKFLIIGSKNATTYKEIFPLIKENQMWVGAGFAKGNAYFSIPADRVREFANGVYDKSTGLVKFRNVGWFTNLDHGRRHEELKCMSTADNLKFSKHKKVKGKTAYDRYENYDAIEVPFTDAIPSDYNGVMGVPISFLDKHNPDQFEILGRSENEDLYGLKTRVYSTKECQEAYRRLFGKKGTYDMNATPVIDGRKVYQRVFIRHRRSAKGKKK